MRISIRWLREWVDLELSNQQLADQLTMAGLEVEDLVPAARSFRGVRIARLEHLEPHPGGDGGWQTCTLQAAPGNHSTVLSRFPQLRTGMHLALAPPGATLADGRKVQADDMAPVRSEGMLCSESDLGLGEDARHPWIPPAEAAPGDDPWKLLELDDEILELAVTPNRGDCLSTMGLARELAALNRLDLHVPQIPAIPAAGDRRFEVRVDNPEACPRYACRLIDDLQTARTVPLWMAERLRRGGTRCIHVLVDITNYVMLELGQPLHVFDSEQLQGAVCVRTARAGERLQMLDGGIVEPGPDCLLITDDSGPLALAGIMGGQESGVGLGTRNILLEGALFAPEWVAGRAARFGLHSEAARRFERGVDFSLQERALERATGLILQCCDGVPGPLVEQCCAAQLPMRRPLTLRAQRLRAVLGAELPAKPIQEGFKRLGLDPQPSAEGWRVCTPCHRYDLTLEADLIEEAARLYGYQRLPADLPQILLAPHNADPTLRNVSLLCHRLVNRGYQEVITYSFVDPALDQRFHPESALPPLLLDNPISEYSQAMRTTLWPGLVSVMQYNLNRQREDLRLFEYGPVFVQTAAGTEERTCLGGLVYGSRVPPQWGVAPVSADFFDVKGDLEELLRGLCAQLRFRPARHPALHPGMSATLHDGDRELGVLGGLHPDLAQKLEITGTVWLFELHLECLHLLGSVRYQPFSPFPRVRRDLALVVDEAVPAGDLLAAIRQECPDLVEKISLFDIFRGVAVGQGKKSLAISLIFRNFSSTLTDQEVNSIVENIMNVLKREFNVKLRV